MQDNVEIVCSVCGVSKSDTKFYLNTPYGKNLCNKHYLQMKLKNKITDPSQPVLGKKINYWSEDDVNLLKELVQKETPYAEISKCLNRSCLAIGDKVLSLGLCTTYKNSVKYKAIYQTYDWCYQKYMVEGLNHDEMAKEANVNLRVIQKWCTEKHNLTQEYRKVNKQLNKKQQDLIIGSMLGDGHIDRRETQPIFIVVHSENQKDYIYYKYEIMKDFCNIPPSKKEGFFNKIQGKECYCKPSYRISTRIQDCFLEYRNKTKSDLLNLLNEFSLAIWILDDSYRSASNWELCVAGYTKEEVDLALHIFETKFNLTAKVEKDVRYLLFDAVSSRKIDEIILRQLPNTLDIIKYKILENNIHKPQTILTVMYNGENIRLSELCHTLKLNYKKAWKLFCAGCDINQIIETTRN